MQVVTFETAKKLKEAGFEQNDSYELWEDGLYYAEPSDEPNEIFLKRGGEIDSKYNVIAYAPTATELIPPGWYLKNVDIEAMGDVEADRWTCANPGIDVWFHDPNPAEAAAKAWLFQQSQFKTF